MKKRATTLVELITVIVIVGIIAAGFTVSMRQVIDTWGFLSFRSEVVNQARLALMRMGRDIRQIKKPTPSNQTIEVATTTSLQFMQVEDPGELRVRYRYVGDQIFYERDEDLDGAFEITHELSGIVDSFSFTYYNQSRGTPSSMADIYSIRIDMGLDKAGETMQIHYEVFPRNLKI